MLGRSVPRSSRIRSKWQLEASGPSERAALFGVVLCEAVCLVRAAWSCFALLGED